LNHPLEKKTYAIIGRLSVVLTTLLVRLGTRRSRAGLRADILRTVVACG